MLRGRRQETENRRQKNQLLTWKNEVASSDWVRHYKKAALDETLYVLTPQGKVVDLPRGAAA
jgi:GTP pyrophosphokinase